MISMCTCPAAQLGKFWREIDRKRGKRREGEREISIWYKSCRTALGARTVLSAEKEEREIEKARKRESELKISRGEREKRENLISCTCLPRSLEYYRFAAREKERDGQGKKGKERNKNNWREPGRGRKEDIEKE